MATIFSHTEPTLFSLAIQFVQNDKVDSMKNNCLKPFDIFNPKCPDPFIFGVKTFRLVVCIKLNNSFEKCMNIQIAMGHFKGFIKTVVI